MPASLACLPVQDVGIRIGELVARSIPDEAERVLQVGRGSHGWLADVLKGSNPRRVVYGLELPGERTSRSGSGLDELFELEIAPVRVPLEGGTVDCIVYAQSLTRFPDPLAVLESHRTLLSGSGTIVCSVANVQHHVVVSELLRGIFPYGDPSPIAIDDVHMVTFSSALRLLLDSGYAPSVAGTLESEDCEELLTAGAPLFERLGVGLGEVKRHLRTYAIVLRGEQLPQVEPAETKPITFVACVNDEAQLGTNLMSSPCLRGPTPHELLTFRGCSSAAEGLNAGIEQARGEFVV
ncbi:MAG: hypothetical protein ACRDV4_08610, partial [Acidimicrobiales bacterium]